MNAFLHYKIVGTVYFFLPMQERIQYNKDVGLCKVVVFYAENYSFPIVRRSKKNIFQICSLKHI
jgi:hypothetical protein